MKSLLKLAATTALLCLALPGAATAKPVCAADPWIKLEVIAGEIAGNPIGIWLEIDRDGCVLSHFPHWRRDAGTYQRQMGAAEQQALQLALESNGIYQFDAEHERRKLELADQQFEKSAGGRIYYGIEDADLYRLQVHDGQSNTIIEWHSPAAELAFRQDHAEHAASAKSAAAKGLNRLVQTLRLLQSTAADARKQKIAEVTP